MKYLLCVITVLLMYNCQKQPLVYPQKEQFMSDQELDRSKNRSKELNLMEREQIQDWMKSQTVKYYPMGMNYWIDVENLEKKHRKENGEKVSYRYYIYDFDRVKLYDKPVQNIDAELGHFKELDAVEDAVRYLKKGEEAELLIPSVLGYGTYGDNKKISNDMPLIIKLKVL